GNDARRELVHGQRGLPLVLSLTEGCQRIIFLSIDKFLRRHRAPLRRAGKACGKVALSSPPPNAYKHGRAKVRGQRRATGQDRSRISMTKPTHESDVAFIEALADLLNRSELAELSVKREY